MILIITLSIVYNTNVKAQEKFQWDIIDSISLSKNQIYSNTKVFIAKHWKSGKDVIQVDDKEEGVIVIKGIKSFNVKAWLNIFTYNYVYTLTFKMKENRFRITLNDIYCESASVSSNQCKPKCIEPFDGKECPSTGSASCMGPSKDKIVDMMSTLKNECGGIIDQYILFLKNAKINNNDNW